MTLWRSPNRRTYRLTDLVATAKLDGRSPVESTTGAVAIGEASLKDSPGKAKEANWLPAPNDTIYMVLRLYWPKDLPPSILPPGEGTWKPPAIVASK